MSEVLNCSDYINNLLILPSVTLDHYFIHQRVKPSAQLAKTLKEEMNNNSNKYYLVYFLYENNCLSNLQIFLPNVITPDSVVDHLCNFLQAFISLYFKIGFQFIFEKYLQKKNFLPPTD